MTLPPGRADAIRQAAPPPVVSGEDEVWCGAGCSRWPPAVTRHGALGASPWETDEAFVIRADLPGVSACDVKLEVAGPRVQINGQPRDEVVGAVLRQSVH